MSKTHSSQWVQAQKAHIDRTASVGEQSHNNLNKALRFHQRHMCVNIYMWVRISEKYKEVLSSKYFFE